MDEIKNPPKSTQAKVDLKKSNPKEYYAQSSVKFKELIRNSQKLSDDIQKISLQIEMTEAKIASLKATLSAKKGLFAVINSEINTRVQRGKYE